MSRKTPSSSDRLGATGRYAATASAGPTAAPATTFCGALGMTASGISIGSGPGSSVKDPSAALVTSPVNFSGLTAPTLAFATGRPVSSTTVPRTIRSGALVAPAWPAVAATSG